MSQVLSMGKIGKTLTLFLTLIIALSCLNLLTFKPANAQTIVKSEIPKPAIPQFNVTLYDSSYEIPTPYDPYYWEHFTRPVTYNGARTLVFTIQNQVFTPFQYKDANNNVFNVNLYITFAIKGISTKAKIGACCLVKTLGISSQHLDHKLSMWQTEATVQNLMFYNGLLPSMLMSK